MDALKEFMVTSQFHGLRFFIQDGRHITERIFWMVCVVISWYLSGQLFISFWESYKHRPVSFVTETDYAHWETPLFSVSVCEDQNDDNIVELTKKWYGSNSSTNIEEVLLEIAYFRGTGAFINKFCLELGQDCPDGNLREIANMARSSCKKLFRSCSWADVTFECCDYFLPLATELGPCYAINSLQTRQNRPYPMMYHNKKGLGTMRLQMATASHMYIHGKEEVPYMSAKDHDTLLTTYDLYKKFTFRVLQTVNEPLVREVPIETRQCRFPDENTLKLYPSYSYSACIVECRMNLQLELCNCSSHLMNATEKPCDLRGLLCLQTHLHQHFPVHVVSQKCKYCIPSCTDNQYEQSNYESYGGLGGYAEMELGIDVLPSVRLKRQVVRSTLDLVVSIGGSAGLFVGASMLSFVEFFYYFLIRAIREKKIRKEEKRLAEAESGLAMENIQVSGMVKVN